MKNEENVSVDQAAQDVESEVPEESADSLASRWLFEASGRTKLVYLGIFLALAIWFVAFGGLWGVLALLFMIALVWGTYAYIAGMVRKKNTWGIIFAMVIVSGGLAKLNRDQERARWTSRVPPHVRPLTLPTTPSPYSNLRGVSQDRDRQKMLARCRQPPTGGRQWPVCIRYDSRLPWERSRPANSARGSLMLTRRP